jgi:hypothetical protein
MLVALFLITVFAGLAGAVWEWVGITRLLSRDHPETRDGVPYPALTRRVSTTTREPDFPVDLQYPSPGRPLS